LRGLTKFPPNDGCDFSKEEAAAIKILCKTYKTRSFSTLPWWVSLCICHKEFSAVIYASLIAICGLLNAHRDIFFKWV